MYWTTDLKCRNCDFVETDRPIDAETQEAALAMEFDCPNCGRANGLGVVPSSLRTRYVV